METKDTGKVKLSVVDDRYLHAIIYAEGEIVEQDIPEVTNYLDLFSEPIPALIERQGSYSISILVQIAMMQQTRHRLKAVAFIERNRRDAILSRIAANTYFRDIPVKSFYQKEPAIAWLQQFCTSVPLPLQTQKQASQ